jgi:hypothetical protein
MNASHIEAAIGRRRRPLRIPELLQGSASNEGNIAAHHADVAQLAFRKLVQLGAGFAVLPPAGVGVGSASWIALLCPAVSETPPWRSDVWNIGRFNRFVQCKKFMEAIP